MNISLVSINLQISSAQKNSIFFSLITLRNIRYMCCARVIRVIVNSFTETAAIRHTAPQQMEISKLVLQKRCVEVAENDGKFSPDELWQGKYDAVLKRSQRNANECYMGTGYPRSRTLEAQSCFLPSSPHCF